MVNSGIRITAAITTYKRDWYKIERAIESILAQTYPVEEILVVDDNEKGSPYTKVILEEIEKYDSVRYLTKDGNFGVSEARNYAIRLANCPYIAFLDDDDIWYPDKIEKQVEVLEKHPLAGLVFTQGHELLESGENKGLSWSSRNFNEIPTYFDMLEKDHVGSASNPLINVSAVKRIGLFRKMPAVEDYDLWINMSKYYTIYGIEEPLYGRYMSNEEHVSTNHKNVYWGYRIIYSRHKESYGEYKRIRRSMLRNIVREGIKGCQISVIPFCFLWIGTLLPGK